MFLTIIRDSSYTLVKNGILSPLGGENFFVKFSKKWVGYMKIITKLHWLRCSRQKFVISAISWPKKHFVALGWRTIFLPNFPKKWVRYMKIITKLRWLRCSWPKFATLAISWSNIEFCRLGMAIFCQISKKWVRYMKKFAKFRWSRWYWTKAKILVMNWSKIFFTPLGWQKNLWSSFQKKWVTCTD